MGTSYNPTSIQSGFQSNDILNTEFLGIQTELARMVNRFGDTPNFMESEFDMNTHRILNVQEGTLGTDGVNLNQVIRVATDIANTILNTNANNQGIDFTNSNPLTFNFGVATGSQGFNNRTEFDLAVLFGVGNFTGLTVIVNGVVQIPGLSYSVTLDTLVTFSESLETDTNAMFIYGDLSPTPVFSNVSATLNEVASTAILSQTVFTAPTYIIGANQLMVHIDGIMQSLQFGDYAETTTTSVTLNAAMVGGERITIRNITGL
jgi:hypothetical protein